MKQLAAAFLPLALSGCAGLQVSQETMPATPALGGDQTATSAVNEPVPGIPMRVKVPVWVQETKELEQGMEVEFAVRKVGAEAPKTALSSISFKCATQHEVVNLANQARAKIPNEASIEVIKQKLTNAIPDLTKVSETDNGKNCRRHVANYLKQELRISDTRYYITHVIPLFGTGSGTFKLAGDGTLTESTTSATDDTGKTLLGLFPIKEKLSLRWGITAPPDTDKNNKNAVKPDEFVLEAILTPKPLLYTYRKDLTTVGDGRGARRPAVPKPLIFADVGAGGAELVSVANADDPPPAKPDTKSYQFKGAITPPEPAS